MFASCRPVNAARHSVQFSISHFMIVAIEAAAWSAIERINENGVTPLAYIRVIFICAACTFISIDHYAFCPRTRYDDYVPAINNCITETAPDLKQYKCTLFSILFLSLCLLLLVENYIFIRITGKYSRFPPPMDTIIINIVVGTSGRGTRDCHYLLFSFFLLFWSPLSLSVCWRRRW